MTQPPESPSSPLPPAGLRDGLPAGTRLTKAHGTGNCFLLLDDPAGEIEVPAAAVAALCDVSTGIGADGLIRCVLRDGTWFMDYRNADGSLAEMCGNGIRVFVDHLRRAGLVALAPGESLPVLTRGGARSVTALGPGAVPSWASDGGAHWYAVDMGPAETSGRADMRATVAGLRGRVFDALRVAMPNPHAVIDVGSREALAAAVLPATDILAAPEPLRPTYDPWPEDGVNLELTVDVTGEGGGEGHVLMRVLERGVGETQSCGTGCCAAAAAAFLRRGGAAAGAPRVWRVDIPGGSVRVELPEDLGAPGDGAGGSVVLSGPAAEIAQIVL